VNRIELRYALAYYRRLTRGAAQEATRRWLASLGASAFIATLTFCLLLVGGRSGLNSAAWGLLAFVIAWLLILAWFLFMIPPRIEHEVQQKEETLRVLSERRTLANELRNHMIQCRMSAQEARAVAMDDGHRGMTPDTFHQRVLLVVEDAEQRLKRFGKRTGQMSQDAHLLELTDVVSAKKCASFDEVIVQLDALADVIERQLSSAAYW
jgi:hypothetical protein